MISEHCCSVAAAGYDLVEGARAELYRYEPASMKGPRAEVAGLSAQRTSAGALAQNGFLQSVDISAHVVHATLLQEPLDLAVERLFVLFGGKRPSVDLKLCA